MTTNICPDCHTAIPAEAPGGFCPACVLRGAEETAPAAAPGSPSLEEVRAAFPQLEVEALIGQGGMGSVYKARQPSLDRTVALKILSPALSRDPAFAERFAREARVLGKLSHPNIVTVYEHGQSGGYYYLLMEYVDGVNLRQAMQAGRFTPQQALAVVPGICDALQAAHAQGVWHRDIKPENILLDARGGVKIADFGIARLAGDPQQAFTLTMTGARLGSAAYMAPEQHEKPHDVDHRADIYSLGVVIYEMLTGELPLGRFKAPSTKAAVDARIDEIVLRTLEKERELRQQSAVEVKTDVVRAGTPASASGSRTAPAANPPWLPLAAKASVIAGVALFAAAAVFTYGSTQGMLHSLAVVMVILGLVALWHLRRLQPKTRPLPTWLKIAGLTYVLLLGVKWGYQSWQKERIRESNLQRDLREHQAREANQAARQADAKITSLPAAAPQPTISVLNQPERAPAPASPAYAPQASPTVPLPDVKEAFLAMNRLANAQDAAAFRNLLTESYQKRSSPLAGTMEFFYGTPVQTKVISFTPEVRRLLFGNTPAKTEVFVAVQQKDGSLKYRNLEFRIEKGGWKFADQAPPVYRARVRVSFRPPSGDALSILRAHVSEDTIIEPVPETAGEFQLCYDTTFHSWAVESANTKATDLDASLQKAGLGSHYQILRPAAPPSLPVHWDETLPGAAAAPVAQTDGNFLNLAILHLPPQFLADIPLASRTDYLRSLSKAQEDRLDYQNGWLHHYSDGPDGSFGARCQVYLKLLPRTGQTPLIFVHLPRPAADGSAPAINHTFILECTNQETPVWSDVTSRHLPAEAGRTLYFCPRREEPLIQVAEWEKSGDRYLYGDRKMDLVWKEGRFAVRKPDGRNLSRKGPLQ